MFLSVLKVHVDEKKTVANFKTFYKGERKENFNGLAIGNKCYDSLEAGKDYIIGCKGSETQVDNCKFVKEYKNITVDEWMQLFKAKRVP
ncbi:hypothetical protein ANCCEY_08697 [Ancylostoma ceylanicum]|uniref:Uncharacterized protein n=2 Tax=Ancylostoma ceylanicum TaxID=53326 RepID=A0A0D6LLY2_9BILA|nr:hypothetical protein ANCCEY_08697 [Ancylostoma ceylanicum]EYC25974.1 hypothetical protein Y032_0011g1488 [Ancylostoma ceylanicum]